LLSHVDGRPKLVSALKVREHRKLPEFLTMDQVRACRAELKSEAHSLLFELMVQAGLRSCEARTLPLSYVFNPKLRPEAAQGPRTVLPIHLDPRDMSIKFDKPRTVHVPWELMDRLNAFAIHRRDGLEARRLAGGGSPAVLLNAEGKPFTKDGVVDVFESLEKKVGFRVRGHMLRHTYATYILRALRRSQHFSGEPLLYVRDRLGHSDVKTTAIYLHLIDQLEAQAALAHEDYVDDLFDRVAA
jgi:integrase